MAEEKSFEESLAALEAAVERLESGELPLEEALGTFEGGVKNAARCREVLKAVETRLELLVRDRDGALRVDPGDES